MLEQNSKEATVFTMLRMKLARSEKVLSIEWLGQTAASLFWIVSVFVYGISSTGDWLQLCAAFSWFVANISSLFSAES